ncbi:SGL-domain-containing protein [Meredithblackwellia eburnea MCA 4105]
MSPVEVFAPIKAELGEQPLYVPDKDALFVCDAYAKLIHRFDLASDARGKHTVLHIPQSERLGLFSEIDGDPNHFLIAERTGLALLDINDGSLEPLVNFYPEGHENVRSNDGVVDAKGRFWSGTYFPGDKTKTGMLYRFDPDGTLHPVVDGFGLPNGMNFSPDNKTLYVTESHKQLIYAYDFDLEAGQISNERKLITFDAVLGIPDGSHTDSRGFIYVAMARGESNVLVVDPGDRQEGSGKIVQTILVDSLFITSLTFGGSDLKDLYITGAANNNVIQDIKQIDPNCGSVFKTRVEFAGTVRNKFGPFTMTKESIQRFQAGKPVVGTMGSLGKLSAPRA